MCICVYAYIDVYMYICIVCIYAYVDVCMYVHKCIYTHLYMLKSPHYHTKTLNRVMTALGGEKGARCNEENAYVNIK